MGVRRNKTIYQLFSRLKPSKQVGRVEGREEKRSRTGKGFGGGCTAKSNLVNPKKRSEGDAKAQGEGINDFQTRFLKLSEKDQRGGVNQGS